MVVCLLTLCLYMTVRNFETPDTKRTCERAACSRQSVHESCTVIYLFAPADAPASAVSVLGPQKGLRLIEKLPGTAGRVVRAPSGKVEIAVSSCWNALPGHAPPGEKATTSAPCLSLMPPFSQRRSLQPASVLARLSEGSGGRTLEVKKFDPSWVGSLFKRGEPTWYGPEGFDYIGMPIGGIGAGTLYLGGDGKLWHWDIFNTRRPTRGVNAYRNPVKQNSPIVQGFALQVLTPQGKRTFSLDRHGFSKISFLGQYPAGYIKYRDSKSPVTVDLEAFSPFIPLNVDDSSFPATVLIYTVTNRSRGPATISLCGYLENAACKSAAGEVVARRVNQLRRLSEGGKVCLFLDESAQAVKTSEEAPARPDILFEDFESGTYTHWKVAGEAFGAPGEPLRRFYHHEPLRGFRGKHLADSFRNDGRPTALAGRSDSYRGTLTSRPFLINRHFIHFLIGGGRHPTTCLRLRVEGGIVRRASGRNSETLSPATWDVRQFEGKNAVLEIVDNHSGSWGHILVDHIVLSDTPASGAKRLQDYPDWGSMGLAVFALQRTRADHESFFGTPQCKGDLPGAAFQKPLQQGPVAVPLAQPLVGSVGIERQLEAGESCSVAFVLSWFFPNSSVRHLKTDTTRWYATRYRSALQVASDLISRFERLASQTRLWKETWYDSTLPYWFLDRIFLNTSILATQTCYRFRDGRFYGYEGVYCCEGTCTHVWGYVQATGRLFPSLERSLRRMVDYNPSIAFYPESGAISFRGEIYKGPRTAVDGQSGVILRTFREHQMSPDDSFLRSVWPQTKKAVQYLIDVYDPNHDGILEGPQHNTLDANWYGKIAWLSSYYVAALRATEQMALDMGEPQYAAKVAELAERGAKNIAAELFNGEYFFHKPDPTHLDSPGVFSGCEYSQLLGQSWAYQVGLGEILDNAKVEKALRSLWRYNFTTDVGPFRAKYRNGRWYAMPGEGGLIACTFPHGGQEVLSHGNPHFAGYLNECQVGYEYAATSLMMWEGFVDYAFAHTRTVHDRYHPSKRNPYNEIECGEHYARSMASYGLFTAVCGIEYYGPRRFIAFSPRLSEENFRSAFTASEGWGTFSQKRETSCQEDRLELRWGKLSLRHLAFDIVPGKKAESVLVRLEEEPVRCAFSQKKNRVCIALNKEVTVREGQSLVVTITWRQNQQGTN